MVKPERGGDTIDNFHIGDRPKSVELISYNFPLVTVSTSNRGVKSSSLSSQPIFLSHWFLREKFVDEFHQ
jgi:hypothetical protein